MAVMFLAACSGVPAAAPAASPTPEVPAGFSPLVNEKIGYSMAYPSGWKVNTGPFNFPGPQSGSSFPDRRCQAVEGFSSELIGSSGKAEEVKDSYVRVCADPLKKESSIDEYMASRGEEYLANFERLDLNGVTAYKATYEQPYRLIFAQNDDYRFQIEARVEPRGGPWSPTIEPSPTPTERQTERLSQIEVILDTIQIFEAAVPWVPTPTAVPGTFKTLVNEKVGYSLTYPSAWMVRDGATRGTSFQRDSRCESTLIVDGPSPGGPVAEPHSSVQICWRPLKDGLTLDDYMAQAYANSPERLADFQIVDLNGIRAYRSKNERLEPRWYTDHTVIFLQTKDNRVQIVVSTFTYAEKQGERASQVQGILDSFQLIKN